MYAIFKSLRRNQFLIVELLKQNLFTQYKQSKFSLFWIIFNPFFQIIVWAILHNSGVFQVGDVQLPYIIYLVAGMILWWYAFNVYDSISTIFIKYSGIILENKLDISVFVVEGFIRQSIFFIIHLSVLLALCFYYQIPFHPVALLLPILLLPLVFFSIAIGLIFAIWRILVVDLAMIFDKLVSLIFFITPILYKPAFDNILIKFIVKWNAFSYIIVLPRNAIIYGILPHTSALVILYIATFVFLLGAIYYFDKMKFKTVEKLLQ